MTVGFPRLPALFVLAPLLSQAPYLDPDEQHAIGVLGGLGPYAGLDLVRTLFDETEAHRDQEHLPVTLISYPGRIPDRATWIADQDAPSPVPAMVEILRRLDNAGCAVAGIPCNTAHAPVLFDHLTDALSIEGRSLKLLHIIDAIVAHVTEIAPEAQRIGVLATSSSIQNRLHEVGLKAAGLEAVRPAPTVQETLVQPTIYDDTWGLKAQSQPTARARQNLLDAIDHLKAEGAEAVILGCTELPLAIPEPEVAGLPMVNSTRALARALIRATHPAELRPVRVAV
ncbi:MAG: amino acid racemase [Bacteroidota bacterium]